MVEILAVTVSRKATQAEALAGDALLIGFVASCQRMDDESRAFEDSIRASLALAQSGHHVNVLDPAEIRGDIAETHREIEADEIAHGGTSAGNYFNLVMADWSPEEPAVFIISAWSDDSLSVYCGAARREAVLEVCEGFAMSEVDAMLAMFTSRVGFVGAPAVLPRVKAEAWLKDDRP